MKVESVASVSAIVRADSGSPSLFREGLGISFEGGEGDYVFTEKLGGVKHLGLWPLHEAARSCFGAEEWPGDVPLPQASVEFEVGSVEDVAAAETELKAHGHELLHGVKKEPWGQTITRLLTEEGLIIGVCYTPWFHE